VLHKIGILLRSELPANIEHDLSLAPHWIKKMLNPLIQKELPK
jgi:hypothetical protein